MSKKEVSYIGLVSQVLKQARKDAEVAGKAFDQKQAMQSAAARWKVVKAGNDPEFIQGKSAPTRKAKKGSKAAPLPGHKRAPYTRKVKTVQDVLDMVDLCDDCRAKVQAAVAAPEKPARKTRRRRAKKGTRKASN